jgi:hypothetical protein
MNKSGFVYFLEDENKICKVGFSRYSPITRCKEISNKIKKNLYVRGYIFTSNGLQDERAIHDFLDDYKLKNEWFSLNYEEIKIILHKHFSVIDGIPSKSYEKSNFVVPICLRMPESFLDLIHKALKGKVGMNRTAWVLQAAQEKLERDNGMD